MYVIKQGTLGFQSYSTVFSQVLGFTLCTDPVPGRVGSTQCPCRAPVAHIMVLLGSCVMGPDVHAFLHTTTMAMQKGLPAPPVPAV